MCKRFHQHNYLGISLISIRKRSPQLFELISLCYIDSLFIHILCQCANYNTNVVIGNLIGIIYARITALSSCVCPHLSISLTRCVIRLSAINGRYYHFHFSFSTDEDWRNPGVKCPEITAAYRVKHIQTNSTYNI